MLICVVGGYYLRCAIAQNVDRLADRVEECRAFCLLESEFNESISEFQQKRERLEKEYRETLARIPKKLDDSQVLSSVRGIAQTSHCSLLDFRPIATQKQAEFQTRTFDLRLEGGFKDLFQFFDSLRHVPYIYQVSRTKVSEPAGTASTCRFDLELKVIFDHAWNLEK